ncbi:MAG: SRPBCC domain-containing protein [candidate division KSB1 bacterium]|nr:SRPBCC domain-containing protein [candidate division KSB1 bacterium]MDZ7275647.1 SRPBCC domain-containing protein [candidate division KSB1 bacterium]MDZ7284662.1 SRPBCC domain-containing protein [candidate division KSB1 bacterium]MDZ7297919.1 SRPBCC domain-containing protein [candidate division KSB1 bacterium]MDZ7307116.1 SRPBCC domain-containing protein [candidate division KSB1 bacterium]
MHRVLSLLCALLMLGTAGFAQTTNKKLTGQSFVGEITVNATPQTVWTVLTDLQKLSSVMNFGYTGPAKTLARPGDGVAMKVWGDTGTFILIYAKPASELRFVWEPDNATYICQQRWRLAPSGRATKVSIEERYTESGPQSEADIATQVKAYNEALARLKARCEGK